MTNHELIKKITLTAVFAGLTIALAFIPIAPAGLEMTFTIIPIAIGGIIGGPLVGLILGIVFGLTSFFQCFGYSAFGAELLAINPFFTFLVCVPTRAIAGWFPAFFNKLLKPVVNRKISIGISCVLVPVLNTLLFTSLLVFCFYHTSYIQSFGAKNPFNFVVMIVGLQGVIEMLCGILISYPVAMACDVVINRK